MGLFSKKKEERPVQNLSNVTLPSHPDLPEFPDTEGETISTPIPEFPNYQSSIANIKNAVEEDEDFQMPSKEVKEQKVMSTVSSSVESPFVGEDKPLFVKIDKYKEVLNHLRLLKDKIEETEEVLKAIEDVRSQEEQKIEDWKRDIQSIKEKLLNIDNKLSEV